MAVHTALIAAEHKRERELQRERKRERERERERERDRERERKHVCAFVRDIGVCGCMGGLGVERETERCSPVVFTLAKR